MSEISRRYTCPLCSNRFGGDGSSCHSSCPMSPGCRMIRCPECKYEFVEDSAIVGLVRRIFRRGSSTEERAR